LIGQGGMGSVWLAERCDGRFEGQVAVKLLNIALMGRAGEERFRREGTILARLTHPHIARLIDAGVTPTAQPYLILEHVAGSTIDRYCDEHELGIEARVRLFLDVLDAIGHAHAATSSPPTSWSAVTVTSSCSTSASPNCSSAMPNGRRLAA
jgi:serine/threonine-protein kinase